MDLNNLVSAFGWTIINSLWQAFFILLVLAIILILINPKYAKIRAMIAYASLLLIFAASIRTFSDLHSAQTQNNETITTESTDSKFVIFPNFFKDIENESSTSISGTEYLLDYFSKFGNKNLPYIVLLWLTGIIILSIKMLGGYFYMLKLKRNSIFEVDDKWLKTIQNISKCLQISKTVKLFESAIVKYPTVIGYFKPVILMPIGTLAEMSMAQVEMILAHELAHVKRADYLLNLIQSFLEILYFFNPAVWIIAKIVRNEREFACDDMAISLSNDGSDLANALLSIHQSSVNRPAIALSALGTKNSLLRRIKRMVQKNKKTDYPKRFVLSSILLVGLFTVTIIACSSGLDNYNERYNVTSAGMNFTSSPSILENTTVKENTEEILASETREKTSKVDNSEGKRKFNFHKDDTHWKGTVENGKLVTLYKDGDKISQNNINKYEDFILDTLKEIDEDMAEFEIDMKNFKVDMAKLKEDLSNLHIDIDLDHINEIKEHFNSEEFHEEMSKLKESLHEIKIDLDDNWKHDLKHELDKLDDMEFEFDKESFKESMENLKENMKDFKIDMQNLDIDLSDLKIDLSELKVEMKMLKSFLKEFKEDLVSEGYLESEDEDFELELDKSQIEVNGKKLPDNLHKRYLKMYKEHFGKELEKNFTIHN